MNSCALSPSPFSTNPFFSRPIIGGALNALLLSPFYIPLSLRRLPSSASSAFVFDFPLACRDRAMEFKFRAGDHRPPPPTPALQYASPRPSAVYSLSKQGFPDSTDTCLRRSTNIVAHRKPFDSNEAMHCEMELLRLREEKLLVEIERQQFLKEEARRELMLIEREMAIRGVAQSAGYIFLRHSRLGAPFSEAAAPLSLPYPATVVQSFNEWQKVEQLESSDRLGFGAVPLPPQVQPLMADDQTERQQLQDDKRKLIVLEKPDPNVFREKRKAETPSTFTNDIQPLGVKQNPKDEWSCVLCQVTVLSEKTFDQHLHGKKHKRKEASLRAQLVSNVSPVALEPLSNKRRKLLEVGEMSRSVGTEVKEQKVGEAVECEKTVSSCFGLNANIIPNLVKLGGKELVIEKNLMTEDDVVAGERKFKFWCEKCKVGAYATEVMLDHLNGKKHQASLQ